MTEAMISDLIEQSSFGTGGARAAPRRDGHGGNRLDPTGRR
jgi:hypothetical protein